MGIFVSHFTGIQTILGSERLPDRAHEFNKFHFWPRTRLRLPTCAACPWGLRSGCNFFACLAQIIQVGNLISLLFNVQIIPNPLRKHLTEDSHHLLREIQDPEGLKCHCPLPEIRLAKLGTAGPRRQLELPQQLSQAGHPGRTKSKSLGFWCPCIRVGRRIRIDKCKCVSMSICTFACI